MDSIDQLSAKNRLALRLPSGSSPVELPGISPPPGGWRTSKGPVLRKAVENFYFAAKAHAYLKLQVKTPGLDLPFHSTWTATAPGGNVPDAGLLTAWYPEVGTLVLAYATEAEWPMPETWPRATPFYLPQTWGTDAAEAFVKAFNTLHGTLEDATKDLKRYSNGTHPVRVIISGLLGGGALAALAAPWLGLSYPSAVTDLVTFGVGHVRSEELMKITEWLNGTRLPVVIAKSEPTCPRGVDKTILVPRVKLPSMASIPGFPVDLSATSIAAYLLALDRAHRIAPEIQTSGSGYASASFARGSFWGTRGYASAMEIEASRLKNASGNEVEPMALQWAASLPLKGHAVNPAPSPAPVPGHPGFVYESFALVPGPTPPYSKEQLLRRLVAAMLRVPGIVSEAAYHRAIVPLQFLEACRLSNMPAALLSDPLSGADAYVLWDDPSGTLTLAMRGTEPYEVADVLTDLDFLQIRGEVFSTKESRSEAWKDADPEATQREENAKVHRGFLAQFESLAGHPAFSLSDLREPIGGSVRLLRFLAGQALSFNHRDTKLVRNIAAVAHEFTKGRQPLRIICTGHSLGGALATLCALWCTLTWPEASISCHTFGSPLVGNSDFVSVWRQIIGHRIRAVHDNDIVPSIPPDFLRFQHVTPAVWLRPCRASHLELHLTGLTRIGMRGLCSHMMRKYNCTLEMAIRQLEDATE
jgi:hypothetical protein